MEQPENADVAVVQTPYSAFPASPTRIERLAGATTDLQHIVHQGHDALRRHVLGRRQRRHPQARARRHRARVEHKGGFEIRRYIKDRTVIEDTESSIDLRHARLALLELPRAAQLQRHAARLRLAVHPAPALGQRRPARSCRSSARCARRRDGRSERAVASEMFLRVNYLASICWASVGPRGCLLFYPFDSKLLSPFAVLAAIPYFVAMSTDLRRCGYKRLDVLPASTAST